MADDTPCPCPSRLEKLLTGHVPAAERDALTGHLDGCTCCQGELEKLAVGDSGLADVVREAGHDPAPSSHSAYWPAVRALAQDGGGLNVTAAAVAVVTP